MAKPDLKLLQEIPIYSISRADRSPQVNQITNSLEMGLFQDAALLVDAMMRDDRVTAVIHTRTNALASLPVKLEPANESKKAKKIAEEAQENWDVWFPDWWISETLRWGLMLGNGVSRIKWNKVAGEWVPMMESWHPRALRYDFPTWTYQIYAQEGEFEVTPGNGWFLYTPFGDRYGWRRALLHSTGQKWLMRQWAWRDSARANEVYGMPIRKAIVPESASVPEKQAFIDSLYSLGNEAVILVPQGEKNKFDLELVAPEQALHKAFLETIAELNSCIAILILGQNLSTEVSTGGSRAAAQVQESVRADRLRQDARTIGYSIYSQVLRSWAMFNYGDADLAPFPCYEVEPNEDAQNRANVLVTTVNGLANAKAAGIPVDQIETLEEAGIAVSESADMEEDAVEEPPPTKPIAYDNPGE